MKLKNDIFVKDGAYQSLVEFCGKDVPLDLGWELGKAIDKLIPNQALYEAERTKIITKYGKKNKEGGFGLVGPKGEGYDKEAWEKGIEELNALNVIEEEYDFNKKTVAMDEVKKLKFPPLKARLLKHFIDIK